MLLELPAVPLVRICQLACLLCELLAEVLGGGPEGSPDLVVPRVVLFREPRQVLHALEVCGIDDCVQTVDDLQLVQPVLLGHLRTLPLELGAHLLEGELHEVIVLGIPGLVLLSYLAHLLSKRCLGCLGVLPQSALGPELPLAFVNSGELRAHQGVHVPQCGPQVLVQTPVLCLDLRSQPRQLRSATVLRVFEACIGTPQFLRCALLPGLAMAAGLLQLLHRPADVSQLALEGIQLAAARVPMIVSDFQVLQVGGVHRPRLAALGTTGSLRHINGGSTAGCMAGRRLAGRQVQSHGRVAPVLRPGAVHQAGGPPRRAGRQPRRAQRGRQWPPADLRCLPGRQLRPTAGS
mmetsp:Transcript_7691/g.24081  ORF Transcript_7691/g.24081 Transcript_7691/m.24081 type:complete len:349 (+) Transcript_7691:193-1239(+)